MRGEGIVAEELPVWGVLLFDRVVLGVVGERAPERGGSSFNSVWEGFGWVSSVRGFTGLDRDDFLNMKCPALLKGPKQ